jgi:hypothetical protein
MSNLYTAAPSHGRFRGTLLAFAFLLACVAVWTLAVEYYRPALSAFPADAQAAGAAAGDRDAATLAASVGVIRGDLWGEGALSYLGLFWTDDRDRTSPQDSETIERAREVTNRALTFSPHDARIWLVLATIDSRFDWLNRKATDALRMSYYTGANETDLIALRLALAVRSGALGEQDFQQLVSHDIRIIVTRKPELKPVIQAAYRDALPIGQQFIEETLAGLDPTLLATIRSKG